MKNLSLKICVLTFLLLFVAHSVEANAQVCRLVAKLEAAIPHQNYATETTPPIAARTARFIRSSIVRLQSLSIQKQFSTAGCDRDHDFQPPCDNNIVDASPAVWKALGVPPSQWGNLKVTWTDA